LDLIQNKNISPTALKAIEAYGGVALWENYNSIQAVVSVKGLAFSLKQRPFFSHVTVTIDPNAITAKIFPIGKSKSICGVLENDSVRLVDEKGTFINERKHPRTYFPFGRRLFYWDDLDMTYFANYAFWNYFCLPKLLMKYYSL
jgi:hypothetical protein